MKSILMIATGGTIACKRTKSGGLAPLLTSEDVLRYVPGAKRFCQIDALQLLNIDSTDISPEHWVKMAKCIQEHYDQYDGFVICHGTDTMAYTAAALSYLVQNSPKPIVITGAQKPIDMEVTDAKTNLLDSFLYASSDFASGVQIVFDNKVILGTRARKSKTNSFDAFSSINYPYLAVVQDECIVPYISFPKEENAAFYQTLNPRVGLLKLIPGTPADLLSYYRSRYDALVLESYGVGGIPDDNEHSFHKEIGRWIEENKILVLTTQVANEGSDMTVYTAGNQVKKEYQLMEAYDMTLEAVVTKLMWILGQTNDQAKVREMFYHTIGNDILYPER